MSKRLTKTDINTAFKRIRRDIRLGRTECAVEILDNIQAKILNKIENMSHQLQFQNIEMAPKNNRTIDYVICESSTSKMTFDVRNGEIRLKISKGCSQDTIHNMMTLAGKVMEKDVEFPYTLRGRFKHKVQDDIHTLSVSLYNNQKKLVIYDEILLGDTT